MKPFVITIGRRIGAGGLETAHLLAETFGIRMYDRELLKEVAKASGMSPEIFERSDEKAAKRGLNGFFGIRLFSHVNESLTTSDITSDDTLFKMQCDVVRKLADRESCIFVGRCADYVLRDRENVLNVFITASMEDRVARMVRSHGWTEAEAVRFIEQNEKKRANYYNYFTFKKWGDSASYDLCIDSSKLGSIEAVVEQIKFFMKQTNMI